MNCRKWQKEKMLMKNKTASLFLVATFAALALTSCGAKSTSSTGSASGTSASNSGAADPVAANGQIDYSTASYGEKTKILAALEKYAMDNHLAGVPLVDDGGLELFNTRVTLPTRTYVTNYGFGTQYATITSPMNSTQEPTSAWQSYFHSWTTTDTGDFNGMDAQGSDVADFQAMFAATLYDTKLDDDKEGYHWVNALATQKPVALNDAGEEDATLKTSKKWRVYVHADESKYVYNTASSKYAAYAGRQIALEDYITPYRLTLQNGWYRATDLKSDSMGFAGVAEYQDAYKKDPATAKWDDVGIQANTAKKAIDFTFLSSKTQFNAMYGVADPTYSPFPQAFYDAVGNKDFAKVGTNSDPYQDVDNVLTTGVWVPTYWEVGKTLAFKKNDKYFDADSINMAGQKISVYADVETAFPHFIDGSLDACGIPTADFDTYKNDTRAVKTLGSTVMKLNNVACTKDQWNALFGPNGTVYPHAANYTGYTVKPMMSNKNFLDAVYFAMNRNEWAKASGHNAAMGFLSDAYMVDPESGVGYRYSKEGKAVLADRSPETNGYSVELAGKLFKKAADEEIAAGNYKAGDTITINTTFMYKTNVDNIGKYIQKWIKAAWDASGVTNLNLVWNCTIGGPTYMDAYNLIDRGETDFMYGAIQGSALDPLNIMNVCCTDNRGGLTLNWGKNTADPDKALVYDGKYFSFDALWSTSQKLTTCTAGAESKPMFVKAAPTFADGKITVTLGYTPAGTNDLVPNGLLVEVYDLTGGNFIDFSFWFDADGVAITNGMDKENYSNVVVSTTNYLTVTHKDGVATLVCDISIMKGFKYENYGCASASTDGVLPPPVDTQNKRWGTVTASSLYLECDYAYTFNSTDGTGAYYTQTFGSDSITGCLA